MSKFKNILIALFVGLCVSLVYAGVTNLDSLTLGSDLVVGDDVTVTDDLTVSGDATVTGALAVTGATTMTTGTMSGLFALQSAADPNTTVTPTAVGQIMFDSSTGDLCVSTAAAIASWVLVSTPTVACAS